MKLPTSSSILIATLAISSSSSCLAAPAGPHSQDSEISKHSSTNEAPWPSATTAPSHFGGGQQEKIIQGRSNNMVERSADASHLAARDGALTSTLTGVLNGVPIVGPPLAKLVESLLKTNPAGAQSLDSSGSGLTPNIDPQDMAALQSAIQEVTRALSSSNLSAPVPVPVPGAADPVTSAIGGVSSGLPVSSLPVAGALSEGDDPNSGAQSSYTSSGDPGPTQPAAAAPSSSGNPSSPSVPKNPPNTPSSLPVPVHAGPV